MFFKLIIERMKIKIFQRNPLTCLKIWNFFFKFLPFFSHHFNPKPHDNAKTLTCLCKAEASCFKVKIKTQLGTVRETQCRKANTRSRKERMSQGRENRELMQRRRRRQRERQKSNRQIFAKQQLCTCITLFCIFLCRHCNTCTTATCANSVHVLWRT